MINVKARGVVLGLAAVAAMFMQGCTGSVVPTTGPHAISDPAKIKIYSDIPPSNYEQLGLITVPVTAAMKWDDHGDSTAGYDALLAKAAALGANGVLLKIDQSQYDWFVGAGYKGAYYDVPIRKEPRAAVAEAIFVHDQK